jgi:hypothetical protein
MGLGIVLIFWAVTGIIFAGIGSAVAIGLTIFWTKGVDGGRRRIIIAAGIFPFLCLGWTGAVFIFQAIVNEFILHRDLGLGDSSKCPLPNGYAILMIDVSDQGTVYNPKTQLSSDSVANQADAVPCVRQLQIVGQYIFLEGDSKYFDHFEQDTNQINFYILIDTKTGKRTNFPSGDALENAARKLGIQPKLEPIWNIYSRYRWTWFDGLSLALLLVPPMVCILLWARWLFRLRARNAMPKPLTNPV